MVKKTIVRVVVAGVIVLVAVVVVLALMINRIAKSGVEQGAGYALGVDTTLEDMNINLLGGRLAMAGLTVANPAGFASDHLIRTGQFDLAVRPGSLLTPHIEVGRFELDGLDLNIEQTLKGSNISTVLSHVKKLGKGGTAGGTEDAKHGEGKTVRVDRIVIRNVVAHFHLPVKLAAAGPLTVKVPEITLEQVSSGSSDGLSVGDLVGRILPLLLARVLEQSQGIVPSTTLTALNTQMAGLTAALGNPAQVLGNPVGEVKKAVGGNQAVIQNAGDTVKELFGKPKKKSR